MSDLHKINELIRHINYVQEAGILLGTRLIEKGYNQLGINLIARCYRHDNSKFYGIEYDFISHHAEIDEKDKPKLELVIEHHNRTNCHHPEFHGSISQMPDECIAEMTCDWKSRSNEFGSSLQAYIDDVATVRYGFTKKEKIYRRIMFFVKILLGKEFKKLPKVKVVKAPPLPD